MKTKWNRSGNSLVPADEETEDWLGKRSHAAWIEGDFKEPRNGAMHRKFFALVNLVFENQEGFQDSELFLSALKIAAGHCDGIQHRLPDGNAIFTSFIPKSISFAKMDQHKFEQFYDRICDVVIRDYWPEMDKATLKAEVAEMCGAGALNEIERMPNQL